jgi:DNA-binding MarR family transcriptional regulator
MNHPRDDQATVRAVLRHFGSLMRHVSGWHAPEFLALDVTMSQAKVLYVASVQPGLSMSSLAAQLRVGLSAASGLVDRLVESGYLERHEDPSDRRHQLVRPTASGAAVLEHIRELNSGHLRTLLDGLTAAELQALSTGMAALDREAGRIDQATPASDPRIIERTPA